MNGVIIVDKPAGWTSHDVVNRMRRILGQRSVGHLGTLDPLATGVLPLVTGGLTRLAQFYTTSEKTYEGTIRFGFATNTYDADGDPLETQVGRADAHVGTAALGCPTTGPALNLDTLQKLAARFQGVIESAAVLRQENPRRPCLQAGQKATGSNLEAGAGRDQRIRHPRRQQRPRPFPRPRSLRHLHALGRPRTRPATRLRSPSRIPPPHRRRRVRHHPSPHPRAN